MNTSWQKFALMVAPNGAYKTRRDHAGLPISAAELAETAKACLDAGAALIHLHVRDGAGRHLLDAEAYRAATEAVRRAVGRDLVIQITSEAAGRYAAAEQMAVVRETRPEAVSVGLREVMPDQAAEPAAAAFFAWLAEARIMTQVILYSAGDLLRYQALKRRGLIPGKGHFLLFVLGRYASDQQSEPADILPFLSIDDGEAPWAVCAFGAKEAACVLMAAALGGHGRVGFENNLFLPDGRIAPDNAALVRNAAAGAVIVGRPLASADDLRRWSQAG
jgi:3-keto-5-aminohexanoate cleavage enzyme